MITDGHMQYLFDEKGKRHERVSFFLFFPVWHFSFVVFDLDLLPPDEPSSIFFSSSSSSGTSTPSPESSPSPSATATRACSGPSRTSRLR